MLQKCPYAVNRRERKDLQKINPKQENGNRIIHIDNYLKCKRIKCINQKTCWADENMCIYALPFTASLCLTPRPKLYVIVLYYSINHVPIKTCSCNYLFFFWLLFVKTDKHLLLLWLCNCHSFNTIVSWLATEK